MKSKNIFRRALLTLAAQYALLLLVLFTLFSGAIYAYADYTFGGDYPLTVNQPQNNQSGEASDPALDRLRNALLFSYIGLVVLLPAVSYLLARRALSPVQKSYKEQQRFVDDASHELRTPLSVLQGELELALRRSRSSGEYKAAISTSLDEIQSLNELITSLLLMARGSQTNIKRSFEVIELSSLIRDLVATCGQLYTSKHLTYQIKASEVYIDGYPELIKRCIGNVLDNACKFTNKNGNIDVEIREIGSEVSIRVHDNGIGMAPEEVKHAYDRFWRAEEARSIRGHGLGLSLVQQIVELHGGKVKIASKKDAGTTVTLLFPK